MSEMLMDLLEYGIRAQERNREGVDAHHSQMLASSLIEIFCDGVLYAIKNCLKKVFQKLLLQYQS